MARYSVALNCQYAFCLGIQWHCWVYKSGRFRKERKRAGEKWYLSLLPTVKFYDITDNTALKPYKKIHEGELNVPWASWLILLHGTVGQQCQVIICVQWTCFEWVKSHIETLTSFLAHLIPCENLLSRQITIIPFIFTCHGSLLISLSLISKYSHAFFYE